MVGHMDTSDILDLMKETAETVITPRFRALSEDDIQTKSGPHDLVTVADKEAEAHLTAALSAAFPGALVIGEEAIFSEPAKRLALPDAEQAFVIDPIDGTRNFVRGRDAHGVMIAETKHGITTRGWIWQPQTGRAYVVERGAGVRLNDGPVECSRPERLPLGTTSKDHMVGFDADGELSPAISSYFSCAFDYPALLHGEIDFRYFTSVQPWDHLAGCLMVEESRGVARTAEAIDYTAASVSKGLLVACDGPTWRTAFKFWPPNQH